MALTLGEGALIHPDPWGTKVPQFLPCSHPKTYAIQKRKKNEARIQSSLRNKAMTENKDDQNMPVGKCF